jgi:hypothetical protein
VQRMKEDERTLQLPASVQFVDERVAGELGDCVQTPCLHVTRYYASELDPIAACAAIEPALRGWTTDLHRTPDVASPAAGCRFEGMKDALRLSVGATGDMPIEAGDGHTDEVAVRQPHGSVVTVRLETS